jgi:hypothetical protein
LTVADDDGIVVDRGRKGDADPMRANSVSPALRERLGHEATIGLLECVESEGLAWSDRVLSITVERFERRLAEELAELRVTLVREIHDGRVETFKWAFLFWIGQMAAFAGLLAFMFRVTGR